jgi:phosphoglycolate phosphatase-like HAD superfamily hydrolase
MIKTVVFDFDGTIADTLEEAVYLYNSLAKERGFKLITEENLPKIRAMGPREVAKFLGVSIFQIAFVFTKLKIGISDKLEKVKVYPGIHDTLKELREKGFKTAVVSSNSEENIQKFLENNELTNLFDYVDSGSTVLGKHRLLNSVIEKHQWNKDEIIYVGDEKRDIEAAKKAKIKIISVTWGANLKDALLESKPDYIVDQPKEILNILN